MNKTEPISVTKKAIFSVKFYQKSIKGIQNCPNTASKKQASQIYPKSREKNIEKSLILFL